MWIFYILVLFNFLLLCLFLYEGKAALALAHLTIAILSGIIIALIKKNEK